MANEEPAYLRFGAFLPPFHSIRTNPTLSIERAMQQVTFMDRLGYDEVWIGEHHSGGWENIASPELFLAAVAERTKYIRLGTGVNSLSYHNPLILADRMVQLDHQTRGRAMFGVGPGQLPGDAFMLAISPAEQRRMMGESLEVLVDLLAGKVVTRDTDWFSLKDARLQMLPYQRPTIEMAVAAAITPNGPETAGRFGTGMLSLAAGSTAGFGALGSQWDICERSALQHGQSVSRAGWRVVAPMHIAETREQAFADIRMNILEVVNYFRAVAGEAAESFGMVEFKDPDEAIEAWTTTGLGPIGIGTVGTVEDAIERIEGFQQRSGGFGAFLFLGHNTASPQATSRSLELIADRVFPHFQGSNRNRVASLDWSRENADRFGAQARIGMEHAIAEFAEREGGLGMEVTG